MSQDNEDWQGLKAVETIALNAANHPTPDHIKALTDAMPARRIAWMAAQTITYRRTYMAQRQAIERLEAENAELKKRITKARSALRTPKAQEQ